MFDKTRFKICLIALLCCYLAYVCHTTFTAPTVSVVMGTYNRDQSLSRAIDSILNQTYKDFEFIIINDGSTDKTADILADYAQKDSRVKVFTNERNKGLVYSLNLGFLHAKGKFIARMDDDDIAISSRLELQVNYMQNHQDIVVAGAQDSLMANDLQQQLNKYETAAQTAFTVDPSDWALRAVMSYYKVPVIHPTTMIRKSFLTKHHISYQEIYADAEDVGLWFDIVSAGGKIVQIPKVLLIRSVGKKKAGYFETKKQSHRRFLARTVGIDYAKTINPHLSPEEICRTLVFLKQQIGKKPFITQENLRYAAQRQNCPFPD